MTADTAGDGGEELDGSDIIAVGGSTTGAHGAARGRARWEVFIPIVIGVVVIDQLSKAWLVANVSPGEALQVLGDWLRLVQSQNSGALFGMFRDQALLFGLVSLGVVALIIGYHARAGRNLYLSVALGLLLGGAIGNLIDRFRLGYVVDWVDMGIGDLRFWTFNVADSAITIAILMLIGLALFPDLAAKLGASSDA
jgi:signal peptidase II